MISATKRFSFPKRRRLTNTSDFESVKHKGRVQRGKFLVLSVLEAKDATSPFQAGFVTSRVVGRAVARNRVRRRLREIVRQHQNEIVSGIWIVTIGASLLMVSTVKYDTVPKPSLKNILARPFKFAIYFAGAILVIVTKGSAIFPLFVLFVSYGLLRSGYERIMRVIRERHAAALLDEEALEREEESTFGI